MAARLFTGSRKRKRTEDASNLSLLSIGDDQYTKLEDTLDIFLEKKFYSSGAARETILINRDVINSLPSVIEFLKFLNESIVSTQPYDLDEPVVSESKEAKALPKPSYEVSDELIHFVSSQFEPTQENDKNDEIAAIAKQYNEEQKKAEESKKESIIPLEYFLKHKKGLCRHKAIFTACVLVNLLSLTDSVKNAQVFCFTTNIKRTKNGLARHMIVLYFDERNHLNLVDSEHKVYIDLSVLLTQSHNQQLLHFGRCYPTFNSEDFLNKINGWKLKFDSHDKDEIPAKRMAV